MRLSEFDMAFHDHYTLDLGVNNETVHIDMHNGALDATEETLNGLHPGLRNFLIFNLLGLTVSDIYQESTTPYKLHVCVVGY